MDQNEENQRNCNDESVINVSITEIMEYIGDGKRMLVERQQVFKAKHIIFAGSLGSSTMIEVIAMCLRSSTPKLTPHQINLRNIDQTFSFWKIICSCKGGSTGRCKHSVAALFYIFSCPSIPKTSCTEVAQSWGKLAATKSNEFYTPKSMKELCCVKTVKKPSINVDPAVKKEIFNILLLCNPGSSLSKHIKGRTRQNVQQSNVSQIQTPNSTIEDSENATACVDNENNKFSFLKDLFKGNTFLNNQPQVIIQSIEDNLFFRENIAVTEDEAINLCIQTASQNCSEWFLERKKRITASKCYELFTYASNKNPNWLIKINNYISPVKKRLPNLEYGKKLEPTARQWYENCCGKSVTQVGFIVHPEAPFLGCSPDGLCLADETLIEIKCAVNGKTDSLTTVLPKLSYLKHTENIGYTLKKKHLYYGQVQLSMLILNLNKCDFIVYGELSKCGYIINVEFDQVFATLLYNKLHMIYFTHFLPVISKLNKDSSN